MAKESFSIKMETEKFNRHIQGLVRQYPHKTNVILKKFALDLLNRIIKKNPVLTGRSRAAWFPSMQGLGGHFDFGSGSGVEEGKGQGQYKEHLYGTKRWIDLINSVRYILFLEFGGIHGSPQAPYGMVRVSMREMTGDKLPKDLGNELQKEWKKFRM